WQTIFCVASFIPSIKAFNYTFNSIRLPTPIRTFSFLIITSTQSLNVATYLRTERSDLIYLQEAQQFSSLMICFLFDIIIIYAVIASFSPPFVKSITKYSTIFTTLFLLLSVILGCFIVSVNSCYSLNSDLLIVNLSSYLSPIMLVRIFLAVACISIFVVQFTTTDETEDYDGKSERLELEILARRASFFASMGYVVLVTVASVFLFISLAIGE
ncbi:hypothetical protein PFISCL1PPCAC_26697, partial [Pristionchus fissidentatus]